jgi:hypothetical protein
LQSNLSHFIVSFVLRETTILIAATEEGDPTFALADTNKERQKQQNKPPTLRKFRILTQQQKTTLWCAHKMAFVPKRRTHPLWKQLLDLKPIPPSALLASFPPEVLAFSPSLKESILKFQAEFERLERWKEDQQKQEQIELAKKENKEPNWVFWEKALNEMVDVALVREMALYGNETEEQRQHRLTETAEADELNEWFQVLRDKVQT